MTLENIIRKRSERKNGSGLDAAVPVFQSAICVSGLQREVEKQLLLIIVFIEDRDAAFGAA